MGYVPPSIVNFRCSLPSEARDRWIAFSIALESARFYRKDSALVRRILLGFALGAVVLDFMPGAVLFGLAALPFSFAVARASASVRDLELQEALGLFPYAVS